MGLFDGFSLKSVVRDVSNVVGAFTGSRPIQYPQTSGPIIPQPTTNRPIETNSQFGQFLEYLPPILASIPRYEPPTQQEIILKLPEETLVYPGHDYNGKFSSTIGNEKKFNPRLQVKSVDEYVEIMSNLNLSKPEMMDSNVSKNIQLGAN